jgi:RNA-directed DNA polymerase
MTTPTISPTPPGGDMAADVVPRALNQDEGMTTTTATADLLDAALASDNLRRAWARVKANRGAPGIDGVSCEDFPAWCRVHWPALRQQIESGRYQPQPVRRVEIPKPSGGTRLLGIPTVMDRVIQQAIAQVLTPLFDPGFSDSSFGFRPGRNAHQAIRQVQGFVKDGYRWAVDLDLAKFFDTVNHDLLMARLGRVFTDRRLLSLIGRYLRAGVLVGEHYIKPSEVGTPQGGPLSPLLANILLDAFDTELHRRCHRFARYADDVVILVKSERAGQRVMRSLTQFLQTRLKLTVNLAKSRVALMSDCSFLSFTIKRKKIRWADKALLVFKHRVKELTGRSWGVSMDYRLKKLSQYLRGWFGYFGISQYYRPIPELDEWIRRRVRMCYWKQWRWARTKIRHMLSLGVALKAAIQHGVSSLSYWRMARTPVTQQAMSNTWLKEQGLLSVKDLWCKAQGYTA